MATSGSPTLSATEISDSYIYLLSRLLVLRQQQLDFQEGFTWNGLVHRKPINERVFPRHPDGEFAICLKGGQVPVPAGAQRIDVPVKYMRVLLRVALGANWDEATRRISGR